MTALACLAIAIVCIAIISRRVPIAKYVRNALRDRRQNTSESAIPEVDQRKPDNDRRKSA